VIGCAQSLGIVGALDLDGQARTIGGQLNRLLHAPEIAEPNVDDGGAGG
jgi:hypothetical protein